MYQHRANLCMVLLLPEFVAQVDTNHQLTMVAGPVTMDIMEAVHLTGTATIDAETITTMVIGTVITTAIEGIAVMMITVVATNVTMNIIGSEAVGIGTGITRVTAHRAVEARIGDGSPMTEIGLYRGGT
jgi:hypothetical protein